MRDIAKELMKMFDKIINDESEDEKIFKELSLHIQEKTLAVRNTNAREALYARLAALCLSESRLVHLVDDKEKEYEQRVLKIVSTAFVAANERYEQFKKFEEGHNHG